MKNKRYVHPLQIQDLNLTPSMFTRDALTDNSHTTLIKTSTRFERVTSDGACFVPGAWMSGLNLTSNSGIRNKPHVKPKITK